MCGWKIWNISFGKKQYQFIDWKILWKQWKTACNWPIFYFFWKCFLNTPENTLLLHLESTCHTHVTINAETIWNVFCKKCTPAGCLFHFRFEFPFPFVMVFSLLPLFFIFFLSLAGAFISIHFSLSLALIFLAFSSSRQLHLFIH